jgi:RecJ-like exonuclease
MTGRWTTHPIWKAGYKRDAPIMDECQECNGTGTCQVACESCGVGLTDANWKPEYETYACTKCVEAEEAHERNLPRDSRHRSS